MIVLEKNYMKLKILEILTESLKIELRSMSINLKFMRKRMISDYRDDNYANIDNIEYIFGDIDNYYVPV